MVATAKKEKYYDELKFPLKELKAKIDQNKSSSLTRFKPELVKILEQEIAFHYRLAKGQIDISLDEDKEIIEAKKVLADLVAYKKLLSPN
ncbi:MAG: hypothetical protein U5K54_27995 [Cytophagales bacterium]|nr:hypothetical protein [Cytophagales bacterium]